MCEISQSDERELLRDAPVDLGLGQPEAIEGEGDVLGHAHPWEERLLLKDDRARQGRRRVRRRGHGVDPPIGRRVEAGHDAHQRALPAAARADDRDELALGNVEVHVA